MRLLLIEDEPEIANLLSRYLQNQGFQVVHAKDGDAGLAAWTEAADAGAFDVVLTDGLLPKKNGYDVCKAIRAHPRGRAVGLVLMSAAFRGAKARSDAYANGIDAYFTKPFVLVELRDRLKELALRGKPAATTPKPASVPPSPLASPQVPATTAAKPGSSAPGPLGPGSTTTMAPPPKTDPKTETKTETKTGPKPVARPFSGGPVDNPADVARLLLTAARSRFEGVLRFVDGESVLQVAWLRGVVVGAGDNLREHALGEWLRRQGRLSDAQARALDERLGQTRERVAEALLALGFVTATEALKLVDMQAEARVRRALVWKGRVEVVKGADAAVSLATHAFDIVDVLLRFALEAGHQAEAERFKNERTGELLERTADFDSGLVAFARLRPMSTLPQMLLERVPTVGEAGDRSDALEVWSLWFGGLLRAHGDPPLEARSVPRIMKGTSAPAGLVDDDAVARVASLLLKVRGVSVYRLLDVPPTTSTEEVRQRLRGLIAGCGREALAGVKLGPATSAARELWTLLDELAFAFSDEQRRKSYDEDASLPPPAPPAPTTMLLEAQLLAAAGAVKEAVGLVETYAAAHPDDVEAVALRGHLCVLSGERDRGVALLVEAARRHPQAVRPLYYLALTALADGDKERARQMLAECLRRAPGDAEVLRAAAGL